MQTKAVRIHGTNDLRLDTFDLPEAKVYTVAYAGTNAAGTFRKSFEVQATERPLEIGFSNNDETIACKDGAVV